jgi:hypothetical protein
MVRIVGESAALGKWTDQGKWTDRGKYPDQGNRPCPDPASGPGFRDFFVDSRY